MKQQAKKIALKGLTIWVGIVLVTWAIEFIYWFFTYPFRTISELF